MLASPLDDRVCNEDSLWRSAIAIDDHPMLNSMMIPDDEFACVNAALEGIEIKVVPPGTCK